MLSMMIRRLFFALVIAATANGQSGRQVAWTTAFGSNVRLGGMATLKDGSVLLAYTSTPCAGRVSDDDSNRIALTNVDASGKTVFDVDVPRPEEPTKGAVHRPSPGIVDGVVALDDGDFIAIAEFPEGYPWMLRLDAAGHTRFIKSLRANPRDPARSFHDVVVTSDKNIAMGGVAGDDFLVAKVSPSGEPLWERVINGGAFDVITSLAADDGGGVVAVGMTIPEDRKSSSLPPMTVLRFNKSGEAVAKRDFQGLFPRVAISRGVIGVSYSRGVGRQQAVRLKILDGALAEVTEVAFDTTIGEHAVAAANDGTFVVLWTRGDAFIDRVGSDGKRLGQVRDPAMLYAGEVRIAVADATLYVAWEDSTAKENGKVCPKVRLSRHTAVPPQPQPGTAPP